ncbi:hypothetical protein [Actinacidiphila acididurans]|uniref:Uncharacterized protein n=1 Tax=Actinacidiphila acididurans TaxID=2784346 RepID=A0ABS2TL94_9ACTN|nr:hypothetical protein [Actinacidiphila acididurans]MBM9504111.1 hypothetical protein [Actinacidiphila acididurans]
MTVPLREGLAVAEGVLGAGLLLMPPVAAGLAGGAAPWAWAFTLGTGTLFCLAIGALALSRTGPGSLAEVTGRALGPRAEDAVTALYLAGFTVGQAAIALAAWRLAAAGLGTGTGQAAWWALLVPVLATGFAARGVLPPAGWRRARPAAAWLLAVVLCADPALLSAAGLVPGGGHRWWAAAFLLLFAGVGWERVARIAPGLAGLRRTAAAVLTGALLVTAACLVPALWLRAALPPSPGAPGPVTRTAAVAAALLLATYCATNIEAAGSFLLRLRHRWGRGAAPAVAARQTVPERQAVPERVTVPRPSGPSPAPGPATHHAGPASPHAESLPALTEPALPSARTAVRTTGPASPLPETPTAPTEPAATAAGPSALSAVRTAAPTSPLPEAPTTPAVSTPATAGSAAAAALSAARTTAPTSPLPEAPTTPAEPAPATALTAGPSARSAVHTTAPASPLPEAPATPTEPAPATAGSTGPSARPAAAAARATVGVGVAVGVLLCGAGAFGWSVTGLLGGPAVATWAAYLLGGAAALRAGPAAARIPAVPAVAALAVCGIAAVLTL